MKKFNILTIFLTGCGFTIHSDPINVNPVQVRVNIDSQKVMEYCANQCVAKTPTDPVVTDSCVTQCYNDFFNILKSAEKK